MKLLVLFFTLLLTYTAPGEHREGAEKENIRFFGTVVEEVTGDPLPGVTVYIEEFDQEIFTDFDGNFIIENLIPGQYNLEISCVSYGEKEFNNFEINSSNNYLYIRLE